MTAVLALMLALLGLVFGMTLLLRHVRADQDAKIAEHWRRNGREWRPKDW